MNTTNDKNADTAIIKAARQEIYDLCNGKKFRMSIPVQQDDSNCILMRAIDLAEALIEQDITDEITVNILAEVVKQHEKNLITLKELKELQK